MAKKKRIRYIGWRLKWELEFCVCIKSVWLLQIWYFTLSTCLSLFSSCTIVNNRSTICQSPFCLMQFLGHMLQINAIFVCVCVSNRRICCLSGILCSCTVWGVAATPMFRAQACCDKGCFTRMWTKRECLLTSLYHHDFYFKLLFLGLWHVLTFLEMHDLYLII